MRDLAFDIMARDRTQAAFGAVQRSAKGFGKDMADVQRQVNRAVSETDRLTAATNRWAGAQRAAGATANDNFRRRNLMFQAFDIGSTVRDLGVGRTLMQQGPQIAQMYNGQGGVKAALSDVAGVATSMIGTFGILGPAIVAAGAVGGLALLGMQHEINATSDAAVSMSDVLLANLQVIGSGIQSILAPAVAAIAPIFSSVWDTIASGFKTVNNFLIAGWITVVDAISSGAMSLPDVFIAAGEAAANGFLRAINQMARSTIVTINTLISNIRGSLRGTAFEDIGNSLPMLNNRVPLTQVDIGGKAAGARVASGFDDFKQRAAANFSTDYLGQYYEAVKKASIANAELRANAEGAGKAAKAAGKDAADPWEGLRKVTKKVSEGISEAAQTFKGFLSTLRSDLQQGKGLWESLGNAALGVLNKIADRAETAFANALFPSGGGGGLLGGIFGAIGSLFGAAKGAAFDGGMTAFAKGGIVSSPTLFKFAKGTGLMGEAGPEAILPLKRDGSGNLGVMSGGGGGGPVTITVVAEEGALFRPTIRAESQGVAVRVVQKGIGEYDSSLPNRFGEIMERHG